MLRRFYVRVSARLRPRRGQAMVEYALILALVSLVALVALHSLGSAVAHRLNTVANAINGA